MAKTPQKRDQKGEVNTSMRPLCVCGQRPAAINYKKGNKTYYRKRCERCLRTGGKSIGVPNGDSRVTLKKINAKNVAFRANITNSLMCFM